MVNNSLEQLFRRAERLQQTGITRELADVCREILQLQPDSAGALQALATWHLSQAEYEEALPLLQTYCGQFPDDLKFRMAMAVALGETGANDQALPVFRQMVKVAPESPMALLHLGGALQRSGQTGAALQAYIGAHQMDPATRAIPLATGMDPALVKRAEESNRALHEASQSLVADACKATVNRFPDTDVERIRSIEFPFLSKSQASYRDELQQPATLYFSALEPRSWFEREEFEWVGMVEDEFPAIAHEILAKLNVKEDAIPYLREGRGNFQDAVDGLVGSDQWLSSYFYDDYGRNEKIFAKFAHTGSVIDRLPLFTMGGHPWDTLISILAPGQHIKPHYGRTNAVLTVHLPIYVPGEPGECRLTAGQVARAQEAGKCIIFDDSFLHEAINPTGETRIVLIFEVWHPDLSEAERFAVQHCLEGYRNICAGRPAQPVL